MILDGTLDGALASARSAGLRVRQAATRRRALDDRVLRLAGLAPSRLRRSGAAHEPRTGPLAASGSSRQMQLLQHAENNADLQIALCLNADQQIAFC